MLSRVTSRLASPFLTNFSKSLSSAANNLRHVTKISDLSSPEISTILNWAKQVKSKPVNYATSLKNKTLLMLFEKPSLRTRVSFETGMTQLGGHAIYYSIDGSPLGKKENHHDTAQCLSRYCNFIMARVTLKEDIKKLADAATIPVINGLDDWAHPYDLMRAACICGMHITVAGPPGPGYEVEKDILDECDKLSKENGGTFKVYNDAKAAVAGAHIVYTDSWMSYHIPKEQLEKRKADMLPFQVNSELMKLADKDAIFMNCLPAQRGMEQTSEVIDGPQSVVFDQAENRLHSQKALLLWLTNPLKTVLDESP